MEKSQAQILNRITVNPDVLVGKPTIRGLRISVEQILRALSAGVSKEELLTDYPELEDDDIRAALAYAAERVAEEQGRCGLLLAGDLRPAGRPRVMRAGRPRR